MVTVRDCIRCAAQRVGRVIIRIQGQRKIQHVRKRFAVADFCQRAEEETLRAVVVYAAVLGEERLKIARAHFADTVYGLKPERRRKQLVSVFRAQAFQIIQNGVFFPLSNARNNGVCIGGGVYAAFAVGVFCRENPLALVCVKRFLIQPL